MAENGKLSSTTAYLEKPDGARLAYVRVPGRSPGVIFLGGFMSDMTGTKATRLESWARSRGRAFLRFDYQGHGQSSGRFVDGGIGTWSSDALAALDSLTEGPQILVGSSMGGWIMSLVARARPERIAGLVGIAAAPDFTEDLMWADFSEEIRETLRTVGVYRQASDYSDEPYAITMTLIEDGRRNLVLREPLPIDVPVRLLHGMADPDVPYQVSLRLAEHVASTDVEVRLVKDGDHRMSTERDLAQLEEMLDGLLARP